jgi:hypothetical protein
MLVRSQLFPGRTIAMTAAPPTHEAGETLAGAAQRMQVASAIPTAAARQAQVASDTPVVAAQQSTAATSTSPVAGALLKRTVVAGTSIAYGQTLKGAISTYAEQDVFEFQGQSGDIVSILLRHGDKYIGLTLLDGSGENVASCNLINNICEIRAIKLPTTGTYTMLVEGYQDDTSDYQLSLAKR